MQKHYFVALAGDVAIAAGGSPREAVRAAGAALGALYAPLGARVEVSLEVVPATREAAEAVSVCPGCADLEMQADGTVDVYRGPDAQAVARREREQEAGLPVSGASVPPGRGTVH